MADFRARQRVQIHDGTDEFGVLATKPIFVSLTDGTDTALVDGSGNVNAILAANSGVDIGDVDVLSVPAPLNLTGGGVEASALRVTIASDSTGLVSVDDNGGSLTIDGSVTLLANSGVDIGDVDVTSVIPGTAATNLGKAEDAAHTTGDTGVMMLGVQQAADSSFVGTDGDYAPLQVNSAGALKVEVIETTGGAGGTSMTDDAAFTVATSSVTPTGFLADETTPDSVDEGDIGAARMTLDRKQLIVVADATTDSQRLGIDASGNAQAILAANSGVDIGDVDVTSVPAPLNVVGGGTEAAALRVTIANDSTGVVSIDDGAGSITVDATSLDIRTITKATDSIQISKDTAANSETNPIFVKVTNTSTSASEIHDYATNSAVAKDGTANHDYTVTGTTFLLKSVVVSASGAQKITIQTGPVASLATDAIIFTSGAKPTEQIVFDPPIEVPVTSTGTIRVIHRNDDNQAMDVYSTIIGNDV